MFVSRSYQSSGTPPRKRILPLPKLREGRTDVLFSVLAPRASGQLRPGFEARLKLCGESSQVPKRDSLANFPHDVKVKVEVVVGVQDRREDFVGHKQMPQVSARVAPADHAAAGFVWWARVIGVARILDEQTPLAGKQAAVACVPCGQHAVHHVNAKPDVRSEERRVGKEGRS